MTDKFNLSFHNQLHDTYVKFKNLPNPTQVAIELIKGYVEGEDMKKVADEISNVPSAEVIHNLMNTFVGDDVKAYGGVYEFLRNVDKKALANRTAALMQAHPAEAKYVIEAVKEKFPKIGALL